MAEQTGLDFGTRLRQAREGREITLQQIADSTKLSVRALAALERNEIKKLPPGIFLRGLIRAYAKEVGLDPEQTVRDFLAQSAPAHPQPHAWSPVAEDDSSGLDSGRRPSTTAFQLVGLSVVAVLVVVYVAVTDRRGRDESPAPQRGVSAPVEPARDTEVPVVGAMHEESLEPSATTDVQFVVMLATSGPCWVSATVDGRQAVSDLLPSGRRIELIAREEVSIKIGDAGAVSLAINGVPARPFGKPGQVVNVVVTPENLQSLQQLPDRR
jgi:cytoskeleton protein RodZ